MGPARLAILLVDDNEDDIVIFREALAESAANGIFIAATAHKGDEAIAYLRRQQPSPQLPDLLLLDINMPMKNGFEVLAEIKADPLLRHLAVIIYTSSNRDEDVLRAYRLGACSYIVKPVEFNDLVTIVRHLESYWTLVCFPQRQQGTRNLALK